MTETTSESETQSDQTAKMAASTPGGVLMAAREARKLTVESVAGTLRIPRIRLQALEADQYELLQADAYVKGYMRAYCKLLGLDEDEQIARYEAYVAANRKVDQIIQANDDFGALPASLRSRALWLLPLALVIAGGLYWALSGDAEPRPTVQAVATPVAPPATEPAAAPQSEATAAAVNDEISAPSDSAGEPSPAEPGSEEPALQERAVALAAAPSAPALTELILEFSGECWLEVSDARGDVLAADLKQAGDRIALTGQAPFNVMLGNARAAKLSYQGRIVDTEPRGANKALRLSIE